MPKGCRVDAVFCSIHEILENTFDDHLTGRMTGDDDSDVNERQEITSDLLSLLNLLQFPGKTTKIR
jgi:hypothetical protein